MSFEIRQRDLIGRIGRLETRRGVIETPMFLPVVNPISQAVAPRRMLEEFKYKTVITNAYLIKRYFGHLEHLDVHILLDFQGVIATDSGAYQILEYGKIDTNPREIVEFQKKIRSDIAVILDQPTGWETDHNTALWTVEKTLRSAKESILLMNDDTLWVGPIQGGEFTDLIEYSTREMSRYPFSIYALGSPTPIMERYHFSKLVDMVMSVKLNLAPDKPLHLFGAGHPMIFPLVVAMGCDMFDSAAYALFARDDRYMTPTGTLKLEDLSYLPCSCPVCRRYEAKELREMLKQEREKLLTEHNLYVCMAEMDRVKQAVAEGDLWRLLELRSRVHPALTSAFRRLTEYRGIIERNSPSYNGRGLYIFDYWSLSRPEVTRHIHRMSSNYSLPETVGCLLLVPPPETRPYTSSSEFKSLNAKIKEPSKLHKIHVCFYAAPFGIIPSDLAETYPLSQFEMVEPLDNETLEFTAIQIKRYIERINYPVILLHRGIDKLGILTEETMKKSLKGDTKLAVNSSPDPWADKALEDLVDKLKQLN
ncbi:MAG: tRNA guanosine(15) transglycosylase TgtA [Candidatus Bathyarchaeia archaeon]